MTPAFVVEIKTPKGFLLRGLWFGEKRAKRVIVFVHGLGGNVFGMRDHVRTWAKDGTAVLAFNNRGHDWMSSLSHATKKGRFAAGKAHEVFTDSADDIQGAINFARTQGVKKIFLAGHSTGCQKSVYWAYKKGKGVKGIMLLAPISDYSSTLKSKGKEKVARAASAARALLGQRKKHTLLPDGLWHEAVDAQRFLSLYSGDSAEELFPYAAPQKIPTALRSIKTPMLALLAEKDEYGDMPAQSIVKWFEKHLKNGRAEMIPRVNHGFKGAEGSVAITIRSFMKGK